MANIKTIYLVDDDDDDLLIMQEAIAELKLNVNIHISSNGRQLLDLLDKKICDALILIDMNMPIMNGIETLTAIYSNPDLKHIRSILISTSDDTGLRQQAMACGAMQVIRKPVQFDDYLALMQDIFNKCF